MLRVTSPAFYDGASIPKRYTCDGENISPPLTFINVPEKTQSLAVMMIDPDSPSGHFTHWILFNLDHAIGHLPERYVPYSGSFGQNDFGHSNYGGPCPNTGKHRYVVHVYALDVKLNLSAGANRSSLKSAMTGHILEEAEMKGLYQKVKV